MRVYGLTGGIGSGKSEAARRFAQLGMPVIDADALGHEVLEPGGAAYDAALDAFGTGILSGEQIDRGKLSALVFHDEAARHQLNRITHPAIRLAIAQRCALLAQQGERCVIIEAALLGENGQKDSFLSGLIVVTCPPETRIRRLVAARGISVDEARRRMAAQAPESVKLALADYIIENTGTVEDLCRRVEAVAMELTRDAE